ncbi:MAG: hypothetical protein M0036_18980 [Desulfobacteraceae bacterium]|nr:hypothetical protein [Desulfobacteraceae bacterium]
MKLNKSEAWILKALEHSKASVFMGKRNIKAAIGLKQKELVASVDLVQERFLMRDAVGRESSKWQFGVKVCRK